MFQGPGGPAGSPGITGERGLVGLPGLRGETGPAGPSGARVSQNKILFDGHIMYACMCMHMIVYVSMYSFMLAGIYVCRGPSQIRTILALVKIKVLY